MPVNKSTSNKNPQKLAFNVASRIFRSNVPSREKFHHESLQLILKRMQGETEKHTNRNYQFSSICIPTLENPPTCFNCLAAISWDDAFLSNPLSFNQICGYMVVFCKNCAPLNK